MPQWDNSEAYFEYIGFIFAISDAVKNKSNSQGSADSSEEINTLCTILDTLSKWIDETPPIQQPQRFGNQAFRTWYDRLKNGAIDLLQSVLPESKYRAIPEIMIYLIEGFGNSTRIDYGTGHEMSFIMFMCSLFKIGFLHESDFAPVACKFFVKYLDVVRKLQITYRMEPAGSHGVWSLDDFQFVPFIWGSSQLIGNPKFEPTSFLKDDIVNAYAQEYMFFGCIQYINQVKSGPFAEHSNQLWSISGVSGWAKINSGLIKMYKVEVLSKFPVVQHVYFGSLFTLNRVENRASIRRPRIPSADLKPPTTNSAGSIKDPSPEESTKSNHSQE
nr:unnamed protein product [Callosobruchus analis]